jgi:plasmid maintenance system antidote protein VapI
MKLISRTLQDAISEARQAGESVYAIAKGAGITSPSLHRFITGERGLTLESADKLAAYFRLELQPAGPTKKAKRPRG